MMCAIASASITVSHSLVIAFSDFTQLATQLDNVVGTSTNCEAEEPLPLLLLLSADIVAEGAIAFTNIRISFHIIVHPIAIILH